MEALLSHARSEYEAGERFLEFRLDYLPFPERGVAAIRKFLARQSGLRDAGHLPPPAEPRSVSRQHRGADSRAGSRARRRRARGGRGDRERGELHGAPGQAALRLPPAGLLSQLRWDASAPGFGFAPHDAHSGRRLQSGDDGAQTVRQPIAFWLWRAAIPRSPTIVLAMGEIGFATRVLSPAFGGLYTYAAPNAAEGTASGQVCAGNCAAFTASASSRATPRFTG